MAGEHRAFLFVARRNAGPWRSAISAPVGILRRPGRSNQLPEDAFQRAVSRRRVFSASFPMILDDYARRIFC